MHSIAAVPDVRWPLRVAWVALLVVAATGDRLISAEPLITNGDFEHWNGDVPRGWKVEIGAKTGADRPVSIVQRIAGPALMLRGDASTKAWRSVSQELAVEPGGSYRLEFDARSKGVKKEGRQYNNCYVGWMSLDGQGKVAGRAIEDISDATGNWRHFTVDYTVPAQADTTVVTVFLSKTGLIGVKGVQAERAAPAAGGGNNLLTNGTFEKWTGEKPDAWTIEVGAKTGADTPVSTVKKLGDAGLSLSGNARTMAWRSLSQDVEARPGKSYTVTFQASATGITREGRQYNNCYVGVMHFDGGGQRLDMAIEDLSGVKNWRPVKVTFTPPPNTKKTSVLIFLSKSGTLKIKDVRVEEAAPGRPFR